MIYLQSRKKHNTQEGYILLKWNILQLLLLLYIIKRNATT